MIKMESQAVQKLKPKYHLLNWVPDGFLQDPVVQLGGGDLWVPRQQMHPLIFHVLSTRVAHPGLRIPLGVVPLFVHLFHVFGVSFKSVVLENVFPKLRKNFTYM